jgi:phage replication-related protein YjqB (UPF0714/DUF867 family)
VPDIYANFSELAGREIEDQDYRIRMVDRKSAVAIVAPHAGKIEVGCSELAIEIAGANLSFYLFEGLASKDNSRLHITSARFDEPRALDFLAGCDTAVGIHGRADGKDSSTVWVGGLDRRLRGLVSASLRKAGFDAINEGHTFPGEELTNICNRGRARGGVQLELPRTLRDRLVKDNALRKTFAAAVRESLLPQDRI